MSEAVDWLCFDGRWERGNGALFFKEYQQAELRYITFKILSVIMVIKLTRDLFYFSNLSYVSNISYVGYISLFHITIYCNKH